VHVETDRSARVDTTPHVHQAWSRCEGQGGSVDGDEEKEEQERDDAREALRDPVSSHGHQQYSTVPQA
jgi:hypothetical protein